MGKFLSVLCVAASLFMSCAKDSDEDADDASNSDFASSASTVGEALSTSATFSRNLLLLSNGLQRAACSTISFTCSTDKKTATRNFSTNGGDSDPCTRGKDNGFRIFGQAIFTFSDTNANCQVSAAATDSTVTRTLNNHYIQNGLAGRRVVIYTGTGTVADKTIGAADLQDFAGTARSGGSVLTVRAGTSSDPDKLSITGLHRRGLSANKRFTFWHTLFTEANAPMTVVRSTNQFTLNGTMYIMHNRARIKVTKTLTNVVFTPGCRHPTSGSIKFDFADGTTFTVTYSSTCGSISFNNGATGDLENTEN